jgi:endonuclease G
MALSDPAQLSWIDIDRDYSNREGYDQAFLGGGLVVPPPHADGHRLVPGTLSVTLKYHHFAIRLHRRRQLAAFTAANIDEARRQPRGGRTPDTWHLDPRAPHDQTQQPCHRKPFQRGQLVSQLDLAAQSEADTFHWSNCAPQHERLNTAWWAAIDGHVLGTADIEAQRLCVFAGPVLHPRDPVLRGVKVPLAYWKVIAWREAGAQLRALGFVVRQDAPVRKTIEEAEQTAGVRVALDFPDLPDKVRGYQAAVARIAMMTGLRFGALATEQVDVWSSQPPAVQARQIAPGLRALRSLADLHLR